MLDIKGGGKGKEATFAAEANRYHSREVEFQAEMCDNLCDKYR